MNTNLDFITNEKFEDYLKDVCGDTHVNIAEKYNINSLKGIISPINPDYKKYLNVIKRNSVIFNNLAQEDHFSFIELINLCTCSNELYYLKIFKETMFPVWDILFKTIYKNNFTSKYNNWKNDPKDILNYIKYYNKFINFWKTTYPNELFEVEYEELVKKKDIVIREIINFCELILD